MPPTSLPHLAADIQRSRDEAAARVEPSAQPRLLVVDDIRENRNILARRFQRQGFAVSEAENGRVALGMIEEQTFDIVLLDVMMPEISGLEVLKRLRQTRSPDVLPVIMVTAKSQSEDVAEALELGANDYVTKPVDFTIALARVNAQLVRRRARAAASATNEALNVANRELEERVAERTSKLREANERLQAEIAQREQWQAELEHLAHHDALTGLANRVLFRKQLEEALAAANRDGTQVAVLFVDLDEFKVVNDSLGHSVGDGLLRALAARLRECLKGGDKVARLGGDEFGIIQVAEQQPVGATALARRLLELVTQPVSIEGHQIYVGLSIGIAVASTSDRDPEQLLSNADMAMYSAKAQGRGTFRFFEPAMDVAARARRALEIDLRAALAGGEFEVYYQPLLSLKTEEVTGFEALLRWKHPQRGFVPPAEFIPVAEEMGLILQIGDWVLERACADAVSWPGEQRIAVNVSPIQFKNGRLVEAVARALSSSGLKPSRLELEITEAVLLEKAQSNLAVLSDLRELGVRICMDDFGTGYSNLSYLRDFHFDKIKIDQSFVRDVSQREQSLATIRAVAALGISLGLVTTAEGVETEDQLKCLKEAGCTEVQGFLFSPARPAAEAPGIIRRHQNIKK
jgi:diguanylate cyclase (GGDEF)-like protein